MSSRFADTVVHREAERLFDVDGKPFPYFISPDGPKFTRLADELWSVSVVLYPTMNTDTNEFIEIDRDIEADGRPYPRLLIGGEPFPWTITDAGMSIRAGRLIATVIELAFLAEQVDTDRPYVDERPVGVSA